MCPSLDIVELRAHTLQRERGPYLGAGSLPVACPVACPVNYWQIHYIRMPSLGKNDALFSSLVRSRLWNSLDREDFKLCNSTCMIKSWSRQAVGKDRTEFVYRLAWKFRLVLWVMEDDGAAIWFIWFANVPGWYWMYWGFTEWHSVNAQSGASDASKAFPKTSDSVSGQNSDS